MPQINNPVLHNYKLAFFCIPKCANASVKQSLRLSLKPNLYDVQKGDIRKTIRRFGEPFFYENKYKIKEYRKKGYLTVCVIRNPYERTISTWANKITHNPNGKTQWPGLGFWTGMSFEDYVKHINTIPDDKSDIHFQSQACLLSIKDEVVPEYIFCFEDFPEAWNQIQSLIYKKCNLTLPGIPYYNKSKASRPDLNQIPAIKEMIYKRYEDDFSLLGYKK